jgi:hypothetical protein
MRSTGCTRYEQNQSLCGSSSDTAAASPRSTALNQSNGYFNASQACCVCGGGHRQCNKGFSGQAGAPCTICEQGKYSDLVGSSSCRSCTTASSTNGSGASDFQHCLCNSGYFRYAHAELRAANRYVCRECPPGATTPRRGELNCSCPANTWWWQDSIGRAECKPCSDYSTGPVGSFSIMQCKCDSGYYLASRAVSAASDYYAGGAVGRVPQICNSCPEYATSPAFSTTWTACKCPADMYLDHQVIVALL